MKKKQIILMIILVGVCISLFVKSVFFRKKRYVSVDTERFTSRRGESYGD